MHARTIGRATLTALLLTACGAAETVDGAPPTVVAPSTDQIPTAPTEPSVPTSTLGETSATTLATTTGQLRVTQHQLSCCYTEGQVSFLTIRDAGGTEFAARQFQALGDVYPAIEIDLPVGSYLVESYQRPCDGNCGFLDPPTDQCSQTLDIQAGTSSFLTAAFGPGKGCTMSTTPTVPPSPVPDVFALREPYADCGMDFADEPTGPTASDMRSCLVDANAAGTTAELASYEAGNTEGSPDYFVYRTNADRTVEVFLPNLGRPTDGTWRRYTCTTLTPDARRGFILEDCSEPSTL